MGTLYDGDFIKVRFAAQRGSQCAFNVFHFVVRNTTGTVNEQECADSLSIAWAAIIRPVHDVNTTYLGCGLQYMGPLLVRPELYSQASSGVGGATGKSMPSQDSVMVYLTNTYAGPRNRGRKYIPFLATDSLTNGGAVSSATSTNIGTMFTLMVPYYGATGTGWTARLFPVLNKVYAASPTEVTAYRVSPLWSQQKRRSQLHRADGPFPPP